MHNKRLKLIIFGAQLVILALLNGVFGWSQALKDNGLAAIADMAQENLLLAALTYILVTVIGCVALALPGVTFAIIAGILFGPWMGTLLCLIATTLGAVAAFLMGRFFLQDTIKPLVEKNRLLKKLLFEDAGKSDMLLLMITRLVPLFPYNLQNFAYGITDIKLLPYTIYTFIFMLPGVAMFTLGSAGIVVQEGKAKYFIVAAALFIAVIGIGWLVRRKYLGRSGSE